MRVAIFTTFSISPAKTFLNTVTAGSLSCSSANFSSSFSILSSFALEKATTSGSHSRFIFFDRSFVLLAPRSFVPMSATSSVPRRWCIFQSPASTLHLRCVARTFKCRVRQAPVRVVDKATAAMLSHTSCLSTLPSNSSTMHAKESPTMTPSMASTSSVSAVDKQGKGCFEDLHITGVPPMLATTEPCDKPPPGAKLASVATSRTFPPFFLKYSPIPQVLLRYFMVCAAAPAHHFGDLVAFEQIRLVV